MRINPRPTATLLAAWRHSLPAAVRREWQQLEPRAGQDRDGEWGTAQTAVGGDGPATELRVVLTETVPPRRTRRSTGVATNGSVNRADFHD